MEKISNQTHSGESFLYTTSRLLERAAYYGLRSFIVLYMIGGIMKMERSEALQIYGLFTASIIFSNIIGAIIGDLFIGNKRAIIIGGIIQALGAFSFCIPSIYGLYIGFFLVVFGGGLYSPNIISNFGKLYLNKTKLLDAGFTILYLAVNLGGFFGPLLIGYTRGAYGWNVGFISVGIIMLISIIPILFSKDRESEKVYESKVSIDQRITNILIAFMGVGLFWMIYELGIRGIVELQPKLAEISIFTIPDSMWTLLSSIFLFPICILAIILWTFFYSSQLFKLTIGFIFGAISFGILLVIPAVSPDYHVFLYVLSILFLSLSEIHIGPIILSILTQYSNPKYLAILISLSFVPIKLFSLFLALFNDVLYDSPIFGLKIGMMLMVSISIGLFAYLFLKEREI